MIDLKVGDKFAFAKGGYTYTCIRRNKNIAYIESNEGIRGRISVEAFDEKTEPKTVMPT
jgi:hypothetical protein